MSSHSGRSAVGTFVIQVAGAMSPLTHAMPRVKVKSNRVVQRVHIKFVGLQVRPIIKYKKAVAKCLRWLVATFSSMPGSLHELDAKAAEYVNELYQDDLLLGWASDMVC